MIADNIEETIGDFPDDSEVPADEEAEIEASDAPEQSQTGTTFAELAEKKGFQSPDDLAKSYMEIESQNKKVEMERADLLKARQESGEVTPEKASDIEALRREQQELKEKLDIRELFDKYSDAKTYSKDMAEYIKNNPTATWETAYRYVKFDDLATKAKEEGAQEAYKNIDAKTRASTETAEVKKTSQGREIADLVSDKSVSLDEIEGMLPRG